MFFSVLWASKIRGDAPPLPGRCSLWVRKHLSESQSILRYKLLTFVFWVEDLSVYHISNAPCPLSPLSTTLTHTNCVAGTTGEIDPGLGDQTGAPRMEDKQITDSAKRASPWPSQREWYLRILVLQVYLLHRLISPFSLNSENMEYSSWSSTGRHMRGFHRFLPV